MNHWFLYTITTGAIYGAPYLGTAKEWTNIPIGCAVLDPFDLATASATVKDAYAHPSYYLVQNGSFVPVSNIAQLQLQDAQNVKIGEVTNAYNNELNGTFTSSAMGTALVYDFSPTSQQLWKELSDAINANYIPSIAFPMNITLANGTNVLHTKTQLQQIFGEIATRKLQLYGKLQKMIAVDGNIMNATTLDQVKALVW